MLQKKTIPYYLFGGLLFVLLLFLFDRGLFFLGHGLEKSYYGKKNLMGIFFQKRDFNKKFLNLPKGTYNTLILGSSRTHRGIHPFYIHRRLKQKAFKIAKAKVRLKFNYYFYQQYKERAGVPKVVIYGLDYFMFKLESHPYFLQFVEPESGGENPKKNYNGGLSLLVSNKEKIDSLINTVLEQWNESLNPAASGGGSFNVIDPFIGYRKQEPIKSRKRRRFKRFDYEGYPGVEGEYFSKLLDQWQKDGVKVALVHLPDYIGTHQSNHHYDRFKKEIRTLTAAYKNVSIFDYNHPEQFSLKKDAYFLDGGYGKTNSHLSLSGARVFHRKFLKDLKKLYK